MQRTSKNDTIQIRLIGKPDFYLKMYWDLTCIDINNTFWEYIFDYKKSSLLINLSSLSYEEWIQLKYLLSKLTLSYAYLKQIRIKDIGIEKLLFWFNIIQSYLDILNKFTWGVQVPFFSYFWINEDAYTYIEDTIFYKYYFQTIPWILEVIKNYSIIDVELLYSDQIIQLFILEKILKEKYEIDISFNIYLWRLLEYENKHSVSKILKSKLTNINHISFKWLENQDRVIFGKNYKDFSFFNKWCDWRKCSFCNIWKFSDKPLEKNKWGERINGIFSLIKEYDVDFVNISDPSITVEQLVFLSHKILKEKINIKMHIRTRFSEDFTPEVCKLLGKAGMIYIGIWLESASPRINNLMNKYEKDYTEKDFNSLLDMCEKSGIKLHYYTIFWLPTETKSEIDQTKHFLLNNLPKYSFFSYTAWFFWLNKWTQIYNNYKKYWITFDEIDKWGEVFIYNYKEKGFDENQEKLQKSVLELNYKLFFNKNFETFFNAKSFFKFIEHGHIFHLQKMIYNNNPYYEYLNNNINLKNYGERHYCKNKYLQFNTLGSNYILTNWIICSSLKLPKSIVEFIINYDELKTMRENIWKDSILNIHKDILMLIQNYIFIVKNI